ncbi:MAG: FAD-dependent oxidoreductase [Clostridia bacterium]|nr:FAD-dependent oxidoreductase [Clostridia bacterium]
MEKCQLAVIGGGPAGIAAAVAAYEQGVRDIWLIERDRDLGGILNQCIHNGFGLHYFKEELTGPEYAARFIAMLKETTVRVISDTMVLDISGDRVIHFVNTEGYHTAQADSIILAMGCRERTRGAISIPGTRCAGIFTAGAAQRFVNMEGCMVGKRVVILGSGDIGLIMSRRLSLEGAEVLACVELMPHSSGLQRNIVQCLDDFGIPLYLSHTVTDIIGRDRVEKIVIQKVDENRTPIPGTEITFECDTLLLSVGLIPENELSKQAGICLNPRTSGPEVYENMETTIPGVFACGNVLHVHDLVDYVTKEAQRAGQSAAAYLLGNKLPDEVAYRIEAADDVTYTVPSKLHPNLTDKTVSVFFRVRRMFGKSRIVVSDGEAELCSFPRIHMAPGEMERIEIPTALLASAKGNTLYIRCEEVSA